MSDITPSTMVGVKILSTATYADAEQVSTQQCWETEQVRCLQNSHSM